MHAIAGHINDNMIVTDENLSSYEGYDVVITVLSKRVRRVEQSILQIMLIEIKKQ